MRLIMKPVIELQRWCVHWCVWSACVLSSLFGGSCVAHSTAADVAAVRDIVHARSRLEVPKAAALIDNGREPTDPDVQKLVQQPLTLDSAVRIALLNNRDLRADLLGLGVERGQLVQANLLPMLDVEVAMRLPTRSGGGATWEMGATVDLTQLILQPARSDLAQSELDAARIRVAVSALDLGYRVRLAYFDVQASEQQLELLRTAMAAFGASFETARELLRAGNTTDLDVATEQTAYENARVAVAEAEADLIDARERLNVLLGLFGREVAWNIRARLPEPDAGAVDVERLESRAIKASLDLAETRANLLALQRRSGLNSVAGVLPQLGIGVSAERHDGAWEVGPQLHGGLPFGDRQQGTRISVDAQVDALRERYQAQAIDIRAATRAARDRLLSARERVRQYRETLLPLRDRVVQQSLLQYNAMQIGVFQLLQARRDQVEAGRSYVSTLHEFWRLRTVLDQLLAGRMAGTITTITQSTPRRMVSAPAVERGH
ncbi:MAG: hypothetical protein RL701_3677 [Pseudomonadota bacterium]|jgi:outer membrane protein TolC